MKCFIKRDIFNFWKYFDCEKCSYNLRDEQIVLGGNSIYLYYLKKCQKIDNDINYLFLFDNKVKLFLKDCILHQQNIIFLILEDFDLDNSLWWLELFSNEKKDIHILII